MKYYAGLDVSQDKTSICVVNHDGDIIKETSVYSDPKSIADFLIKINLPFDRIGFESGPISAWLYKGLAEKNLPIFCIDARHTNAALKAQNVKTDRNDARGIAHIMRTGWFKNTHVKSDESQKLRMLLNTRKTLVARRLDIENQIRGSLKVFGLKIGQTTTPRYQHRVYSLIKVDEQIQVCVEPLLEVRRHIIIQCRKLDSMIRNIVKHDEVCRRFMGIPGVGPLTALFFKSTIDDPHRFSKSGNVAVHLGLTPRKYASGQIDYDGRITKCGDALMRSHLYEAAQVLMRRSSKKSDLKSWGTRIAKRGSMKKAYVAVARKLAVIMHRMWVDGTEFRYSSEPQVI